MDPLPLVLGFVPVLLFLAGLIFMDSYKLVRRHEAVPFPGGSFATTGATRPSPASTC